MPRTCRRHSSRTDFVSFRPNLLGFRLQFASLLSVSLFHFTELPGVDGLRPSRSVVQTQLDVSRGNASASEKSSSANRSEEDSRSYNARIANANANANASGENRRSDNSSSNNNSHNVSKSNSDDYSLQELEMSSQSRDEVSKTKETQHQKQTHKHRKSRSNSSGEDQDDDEDPGEQQRVKAMQWNCHGECFEKCSGGEDDIHCDRHFPKCRNGAERLVKSWLKDQSLDFLGLELFYDDGPFKAGAEEMANWLLSKQACGGSSDKGSITFPYDIARLLVNNDRWELLGEATGGCAGIKGNSTEPNYRAFVAQAVKRKVGEERFVVLVAHFPHKNRPHFQEGIDRIKSVLKKVSEEAKTNRFLLIADTNFDNPAADRQVSPMSSADIISLLVEADKERWSDTPKVASSSIEGNTCCWPDLYGGSIDRIIAVNFKKSSFKNTELPFGTGSPPFAAQNMHNPIFAEFAYMSGGARRSFGSLLAFASVAASLVLAALR